MTAKIIDFPRPAHEGAMSVVIPIRPALFPFEMSLDRDFGDECDCGCQDDPDAA